jgi:Phenazine biosynthesis-like protein
MDPAIAPGNRICKVRRRNPLAVVLDSAGLTTAQMQALAREFNYSEATFVFDPQHPVHTPSNAGAIRRALPLDLWITDLPE